MGIATDMANLRSSINKSRSERKELMRKMDVFSLKLSLNVAKMLSGFEATRLKEAKKNAAERAKYVQNLKGGVATFLTEFSKELGLAGAAFRGTVTAKKASEAKQEEPANANSAKKTPETKFELPKTK